MHKVEIDQSMRCLLNLKFYGVCLTHIRGLLGSGGCDEKLSLSGEPLLHHFCLKEGKKCYINLSLCHFLNHLSRTLNRNCFQGASYLEIFKSCQQGKKKKKKIMDLENEEYHCKCKTMLYKRSD